MQFGEHSQDFRSFNSKMVRLIGRWTELFLQHILFQFQNGSINRCGREKKE